MTRPQWLLSQRHSCPISKWKVYSDRKYRAAEACFLAAQDLFTSKCPAATAVRPRISRNSRHQWLTPNVGPNVSDCKRPTVHKFTLSIHYSNIRCNTLINYISVWLVMWRIQYIGVFSIFSARQHSPICRAQCYHPCVHPSHGWS